MGGERKDCPSEAPRCGKGRGDTFQILNADLDYRVLSSIAESQKRNGRIVGLGCDRGSVHNAIAGIPSAASACTIQQHSDATLSTVRKLFETAARAGKLVQGENSQCGGNNPADRIWNPRPTELVWVEANVAVGGTKLPFPKPIRPYRYSSPASEILATWLESPGPRHAELSRPAK